jgi:hypothetical protein
VAGFYSATQQHQAAASLADFLIAAYTPGRHDDNGQGFCLGPLPEPAAKFETRETGQHPI